MPGGNSACVLYAALAGCVNPGISGFVIQKNLRCAFSQAAPFRHLGRWRIDCDSSRSLVRLGEKLQNVAPRSSANYNFADGNLCHQLFM